MTYTDDDIRELNEELEKCKVRTRFFSGLGQLYMIVPKEQLSEKALADESKHRRPVSYTYALNFVKGIREQLENVKTRKMPRMYDALEEKE